MGTITIEPLTPEAFAPFGDVLTVPPVRGRAYFPDGLGTARDGAQPNLSLATVTDAAALPLTAHRMERHQYSSQSFVPLCDTSLLVIVAPHGPDGMPDTGAGRAFVAEHGLGVTYRMNTWHHPLTLLRAPASFAIFMWLDGSAGDEEFVDVDPFVVKER